MLKTPFLRPKTWALSGIALSAIIIAVSGLSSCDVFDSLAEADRSALGKVQDNYAKFTTLADSYSLSVINRGIHNQDMLFLTPEGTIRWNRSENSFERFGGKLPILSSGSEIYGDTQNNFRLYDRLGSVYYLEAKGSQWQEQPFKEILPDELKESGVVLWSTGQSGEEVAIAAVLKTGTKTYHFMKRQKASENFRPWFQWEQQQEDFVIDNGNELHLQPNGDLLIINPDKPFVVKAGTQKPVPIFDCSVLINKHCSARVFLRGNEHGKIYAIGTGRSQTQVYKIAENTSFPVVPEALPVLEHAGKTAGIFLDPKGELFAVVRQEDAETIPVAPFTRDVATLMQLQGNRWVTKKTFYPTERCCFIGPDSALYSAGFQLAPGGVYVGEPVYRLAY